MGRRRERRESREPQYASTQSHIPIKEIREGIVVLKGQGGRDGGYRLILRAMPINLELMSYRDQESIRHAYKAFLDSLSFDIQFVNQSRLADLNEYIKLIQQRVRAAENEAELRCAVDYLQLIEDLLEVNQIMTKVTYVVIPYDHPVTPGGSGRGLSLAMRRSRDRAQEIMERDAFAHAKRELNARKNHVIEGLSRCRVACRTLTDAELVELFYAHYNKNRAVSQPVKGMGDLQGGLFPRLGEPPER